MSQIFPKSANSLARASIILMVLLGGIVVTILLTLPSSDYITRRNMSRTQPVQFSHAHHAGGMGFDCRYCHTSVEESNFAGIRRRRRA